MNQYPFASLTVSCPHCEKPVEVNLGASVQPMPNTAYTVTTIMVEMVNRAKLRMDEESAYQYVLRRLPNIRLNKDDRLPKFSFQTLLYTLLEPHGA